MNFENSVCYALVKYNVVLNIAIWESDEEFLSMEESLYKDPFLPKDSVWMRVPDHNKDIAKRYLYNKEHNFFHAAQPYPSWILDVEKQRWVAPVPEPGAPWLFQWNEDSLEYDIIGKRYNDLDNVLETLENE